MNRQELESLSTPTLQQIIGDAASVLATRAVGQTTSPPEGASLFTFGATTSGASSLSTGFLFGNVSQQGSIFGSAGDGKLFGGTGGGLFGGSDLAAARGPDDTANADKDGGDGDDGDLVKEDEEEVTAIHGWTPSMTLQVMETFETGEEEEELLYSQRSKLYRFKDGDWKERGLGESKLLKHKVTGRIRFLLRQEKTFKVVANHYVVDHKPYCDLHLGKDSEKIWVWAAQDFADGEPVVEEFALKFGTVELAAAFKEAFDDAKRQNSETLGAEQKGGKDTEGCPATPEAA